MCVKIIIFGGSLEQLEAVTISFATRCPSVAEGLSALLGNMFGGLYNVEVQIAFYFLCIVLYIIDDIENGKSRANVFACHAS